MWERLSPLLSSVPSPEPEATTATPASLSSTSSAMLRTLEAKVSAQGNLRAVDREKIDEVSLGRRGSLEEEDNEEEDETLDTEKSVWCWGDTERSNIVC